MVREIINVSVGQCGNQINNSFWETICAEHSLSNDGKLANPIANHNDKINVYFNETITKNQYSSRSIIVDTDPSSLDKLKGSSVGDIFKPDNFCFGSFGGGTGNNWAKGHYTDGAEMIDEIVDIIRIEAELCDCPQGFQMLHSIGGGTGSGLGTLILLKIRDLFPDIITSNFSIFPSNKVSDIVVQPYNATLSIHQLLENSDQTNVIDNEALFNISTKILKLLNPKYSELNWIISNVMSDVTSSLRFSGKLNGDLRKLGVNLIPHPRLHFFLLANAPLFANKDIGNKTNLTVQEITDQMWSSTNFMCAVNPDDGKYNTAACIYRGDIPTQAVDNEILKIQQRLADDFVTYIPNNIKSSLVDISPPNTPISGTLIANTTAMKGIFQRIAARFAKMYKRKAFIHWYKGEGMDEMEFQEADKNNRDLITEYQDKQDAVVDLDCDDDWDDDDDDDDDYDDDGDDDDDDDTIGFAVGGAKDVNNFRKLIEKNLIPTLSSLTYNGLLYEYFFDTKTRKSATKTKTKTPQTNDQDDQKDDKKIDKKPVDGSNLFYPSYCYAKTKKIDFVPDQKSDNSDFEYYMTVGLNSNIKKSEFKRKKLNITIVLDRSGSMGCTFPGEYGSKSKTRMKVANEACITLLKHLKADDRFGFIAFDHRIETIHELEYVKDIDFDKLKKKILSIKAGGENEFCDAYKRAIKYYNQLFSNKDYNGDEYENRIMFLTDAQIHIGCSDPNLLKYVANDAEGRKKNKIYTTFIGIGLDFYAVLCEQIASTRGCNYYSVKSSSAFVLKMDEEFEFMVTPMVFNVCLKINCEGNVCSIEKVYGAKDKKAEKIKNTGEIKKIGTLFPSLKSKKKGGTKGGIQLIKLKKNSKYNDKMNVELEVSFEDRNGNKYFNKQLVTFDPPKLTIVNDMIGDDDDDDDDNDDNENFYDNLGIRKGILLCKYVELLHSWISAKNKKKYKTDAIFETFLTYFKKEMKKCNDNDLKKEIDILNKLINEDFIERNSGGYYNNNNNDDDDDDDDDDEL